MALPDGSSFACTVGRGRVFVAVLEPGAGTEAFRCAGPSGPVEVRLAPPPGPREDLGLAREERGPVLSVLAGGSARVALDRLGWALPNQVVATGGLRCEVADAPDGRALRVTAGSVRGDATCPLVGVDGAPTTLAVRVR